MVNYWAIQIGINQYRFLPPLSYAQRDAERLTEVLIQVGMLPRQCSLLADQATLPNGDARFPIAQNIQALVAQYQRVMQPKDVLLFFFSGYGLRYQGKEYLMPIEGDPQQIVTTGIEVETLFKAFKAAPFKVLVILDANRSQLGIDRGGFGEETIQLAEQYGIATMLSCQPTQFSHEPLTLRQGIFTTALIQAIQAGCTTVEQLVQAVTDRLPELSEECWRPRQDVLAFVPPHMRYQLILPDGGRGWQAVYPVPETVEWVPNGPVEPLKETLSRQAALLTQMGSGLTKTVTGWFSSLTKSNANLPPFATESGSVAASLPHTMLNAGSAGEGASAVSDEFFWRRLLMQGGLIASILLFGVVLRNGGTLISSADRAIDRLAPTAQLSPNPAVPTNPDSETPASATPSPIISWDPVLLMQSAEAAFQAKQFGEANRQLGQIPADQRTPEQNQLLQQTNQALLDDAKTMLIRTRDPRSENQVSDFVEAIKIARLIKSGQPLYPEAQQNIDRWSRVILDMSEGRATRSTSESAMENANNYKTAISAARLVPTDQPIHAQAEQAIESWSQRILDLANESAKANDFDLAIQIGELVPPYTPVYASAQEAIAGWRSQPISVVNETLSDSGREFRNEQSSESFDEQVYDATGEQY